MAGDQSLPDDFMWGNHSHDFSNFSNSCKGKEKLDPKKSTNQKQENEKKVLVIKKQCHEILIRSEKNKSNGEMKKDEEHHESNKEAHALIERKGRRKMMNMFASLHNMLPELPSKVDKSTIVNEAVNHIKNLQQTLEKLEKQKQERLKSVSSLRCESSVANSQLCPFDSNDTFIANHHGSFNNNMSTTRATSGEPQMPITFQSWFTPNLVLNICGDEAQLCIYATKKPSLLTTIAFVMHKHNIDVIFANILRKGTENAYMIQAHVKRASHQFLNTSSMEETYQQVAEEIAKWIA